MSVEPSHSSEASNASRPAPPSVSDKSPTACPPKKFGIRIVEFKTPAANGKIAFEPVNHESQECELIDHDVAVGIKIVRIRLPTRGRIQERQNVAEKPLPPARIQ